MNHWHFLRGTLVPGESDEVRLLLERTEAAKTACWQSVEVDKGDLQVLVDDALGNGRYIDGDKLNVKFAELLN